MSQALWIAKTGLDAQQTRVAIIANNLANVNTIGFKKARPNFEDLLYQNVRQVGAQSSQNTQLPSGLNIGTGVRIVSTDKNFSQGNHVETSGPLDLAIQGRGFFQIQMPDGSQAYTRNGSFMMDSQGQMVTPSGNLLQPAVTLPEGAQSITIGIDGVITATLPNNPAPVQVGTIQLADFINPVGLQPIGQNLFLESASSGSPQTGTAGLGGLGTLMQGALETSNVNVVEELVAMIEAQRAYEMNSKAISATDRMLQYVSNNL